MAKTFSATDLRLPSPEYFPFQYVDVRVPTVGKFSEAEIASEGSTIRILKTQSYGQQMAVEQPIIAKMYPTSLATTLQYAQGFGDVALRQFVREHVKVVSSWV